MACNVWPCARSYALCGFSNFGSMGITLGTLSAICPSLRAPLARDLLRALAAGTLACLSTACMASALYSPDREFSSYECHAGSNATADGAE